MASSSRLWPLVAAALISSTGCAAAARSLSFPSPAFRSASTARDAEPARAKEQPSAEPSEGAALVERSLRERGLTLEANGTMGALYAQLRDRHQVVPATEARPGDLVFFDLSGDGGDCGGHGGVVEAVDDSGRIEFRERRDGAVRRSYVHPREPVTRRDERGRLLNTFLRVRRQEDPPATRYFAGEMLCAVIRPIGGKR